jgi:aromatic-L-amino-acid decarboxylase
MIDIAAERVLDHVETLGDQDASYSGGGEELAAAVSEPLPETGQPFEGLMDLLFDRLLPKTYSTAGPGFLAYIPGGGLVESALADLVADVTNRYVTVWLAAPGLYQLEANVVRWFCEMLGYGEGSGGFLTSGGSLANLSAVVVARRERLPEQFLGGTIYVSEQVHHSMVKAATLAGFPARNVRRVPVDERFAVRLDRMEEAVRADRQAGREPFLVVASAGTTNTGAIDDLPALAALARREGLWLHCDAAYGGFFALTERGRRRLRGIGEADSITLNPHKGLFLPYGNGCLLVRDVGALERTHALRGEYMPPSAGGPGRPDVCDISPELSRDFRGLRAWLPLKLHGAAEFRRQLDEKLDLALWAERRLEETPGIEIVARARLSLVAFRLRPEGCAGDELDVLNRALLDCVNARQNVFLTGTVVDSGFVLRICVLSFRTHLEHLELAMRDIEAAIEEVLEAART